MNRNGGILALVVGFLFTGYLLVYAAVANKGKFAGAPWNALIEDAYTGEPAGRSSSSKPSPLERIWDKVNPLSGLKHETIPAGDIHARVHREIR